jgi:hypothetical protein
VRPLTPSDLDWAPLPVRPIVESTIAATQADPRIIGLTIGGSAATNTMDEFSDLDFVIVCRDEHHQDVLRDGPHIAEAIGPLLSWFTAEHVREPRLLICLYGPPLLHVDLKFVSDSDLDRRVETGLILWQRDVALDAAFHRAEAVWPAPDPQWIEDRFWTWIHYGATKVGRGELFDCLEELAFLRRTVFGPLIAHRRGHRANGVRRLEQIAPELVPAFGVTVGNHTPAGCLSALRASIDLYRQLRALQPDLVRRSGAEHAAIAYLAEIESRFEGGRS